MSIEHCEYFHEISSNGAYHCLIAFKFIICLIGAAGICYQWRKQGVRFLVHENTKLLQYVSPLITWSKLYGTATYFIGSEPTIQAPLYMLLGRLPNYFAYKYIFRGIAICSVISSHVLITFMSVERLYSSLYPEHFEKNSNKKISGFASLLVIFLSWSFAAYCLTNGFSFFGGFLVSTNDIKISQNSETFSGLAIIGSVYNILTLFAFTLDIYLNFIRTPTEVNPTLSVSYQRAENRRVILIILPIELIDTILLIFSISAIIFQNRFLASSPPAERIYFKELFAFPPYFPLILATIIEFRVARRSRTPLMTNDTHVDHFENLRNAWN